MWIFKNNWATQNAFFCRIKIFGGGQVLFIEDKVGG